RHTDRHHTRTSLQRSTDRGIHRRLRRPIPIDHHPTRRPPIHHIPRTRLSSHHQRRHRRQLLRIQNTHRRRRLAQHRHTLSNNQRLQILRRTSRLLRHYHQAPTVQQRTPDLPHRKIERQRRTRRPHLLR